MKELKFSRYNILFQNESKKYVYNTLSTAIAQLDDRTYTAILDKDISLVEREYFEAMSSQHFLVDSDVNEAEEYLYFYNNYRFGRSAGVLSVTLVPTYSCNLACTYCMQGNKKTNERISSVDTSLILSFVESEVIASKRNGVPIKKIHAGLYGGEPMLHKSALIQFSNGIKDIAERLGCETDYSMTSNLTLLDSDFIDLIDKHKISVQVSIDGSEENHNSRRIKHDGSETYRTIIDNIKQLNSAGLKDYIVIRVNIDRDNLEDAERVLKEIHELSNDVYFGFIDSFAGLNDSFTEHCVSRESYSDIVTKKFDDLSRKYGFAIPARFGKQSPCTMNSVNKYFIDLQLNVYKCEMFLNKPDARVGTLSDTGKFLPEAGYYRQMNRNPGSLPECLECKLLPMCAGGCAGKMYISSKRSDGQLTEHYCMYKEADVIDYLKSFVQSELISNPV